MDLFVKEKQIHGYRKQLPVAKWENCGGDKLGGWG